MTETKKYLPGDFTFWNDEVSQNMMDKTWEVISENDLEFLKTYEPPKDCGFMWTKEEDKPTTLREIESKVGTAYSGHSGSSHAWTMRTLQSIATNGWDTFVESALLRIKKKNKSD